MDTLKNTGVATKNKGDGLSAADVNAINGTVNQAVNAINSMLISKFNVNAETGDLDRFYTLEEAIAVVPENRKKKGLTVRYLAKPGFFNETTFLGDTIDDWNNPDVWGMGGNIIDGGEW